MYLLLGSTTMARGRFFVLPGSQYYDELLDARYTTLNDGVRYTLQWGNGR